MDSTRRKLLIGAAAGGVLAAVSVSISPAADSPDEKCYGMVRAGKNDCHTPEHSCGGLSKVDGHPQEWINVKKGNCEKIVGGSLTPIKK